MPPTLQPGEPPPGGGRQQFSPILHGNPLHEDHEPHVQLDWHVRL